MNAIVFNSGNFFMALLAGVLLALSFQFVLTILSTACGITMIGNVEDKFKGHATTAGKPNNHPFQMVVNGIGLWMVVTVCISLFFATLLAIKISLISDNAVDVTLALSIWAVFFLTMAVLEIRTSGALLGGILSTVFHWSKSSAQMIQAMFGKSETEKTMDAIRAEVVESLRDPQLSKNLNKLINTVELPSFDWDKARKELAKLLSGMELKANVQGEAGEKEAFIKLAMKHPQFSSQDINKLGEVFDQTKESFKKSAEDAQAFTKKMENYLKSTGIEALNPESLKEDLNKIVNDPQIAKSVVLNRIKQFDHPTLVSIVSKKANMSPEQADQVVGKLESAIASIKEKVSEGKGQSTKENMEDKLRNFFNSLQRPEFNYDGLKHDFEEMLHDPKATPHILRERFKTFDRESLIALISSNPKVSRSQAQEMVGKIEEVRQLVLKEAEQLEEQVRQKVEEAKKIALHQTEQVRQNAVLCAWWIFGAAVLSAVASALGGLMAF